MKITPKNLKGDIDALIAHLLEKGICDDSNFSSERPISSNKFEITFKGSEHISDSLANIDYADIYKELLDKRSYNMKLIDGALIQIMYIVEEGVIKKHRLAFYPSPQLLSFQNNTDDYMQDELYVDITQRKIIPFPIRFDFDPESHIDVIHPKSHLTLGDAKNCRIPLTMPITPRWFIEFILRNFYQSEKYDFIATLPQHKIRFSSCITDNEKKIIHLVIPDE